MGKISGRRKQAWTWREKRRSSASRSKYLKPGDLAQIRYNKLAIRSCTDLRKKQLLQFDAKNAKYNALLSSKVMGHTIPLILSPERNNLVPSTWPMDGVKSQMVPSTPKTPQSRCEPESRFETLPMDLLVKIFCHLHHDQLRASFHVSRTIRKAVLIAKQYYFNYTTPDRTRQEILMMKTPITTDRWPFGSKGAGKMKMVPSPHTPRAPRRPRRPPHLVRPVAAVLFQESSFGSKYLIPHSLSKPQCKPFHSSRVLFYEDELCQAVAQNKLR